ncbi:MAG: NAD-dependent epimerase/dehydratase family protein [Chloroflexi bacterium]|nr:NAD-dependent epimerase/dehydratase family protein [Chloroflexota bacterium]
MDEVFLTGGTGFVGAHVLRALVEAGYRVRALVHQHPERLPAVDGVTPVQGDLMRSGALVAAMAGCRYLVHVAALYSFAPTARRQIQAVNVEGTRGLLVAARLAGIERALITSSSATVGPAQGSHPADEHDRALGHDGASGYHHSKAAQEAAALAARVPVVLVLPTAPVGPGDWRPTPTGRMILDVIRGRMPASVDGGMNLVAVEDVARAHVLALAHGRPRERYLVGGENLSFDQIWSLLAEISGRPAPRTRLPHSLPIALAWADELRCRAFGAEPWIPLEGARMARYRMFVSDAKARRELGYQPTGVRTALARAVEWYRRYGYTPGTPSAHGAPCERPILT